jgi:nucleoid DNA-binding protein
MIQRISLNEFLHNQKKEIVKRVAKTLEMKETLITEYFDREIERVKSDLIKHRKALNVFGMFHLKSSEEVRFESKSDEINLQLETVFKMKMKKVALKELLPNTSKITMDRVWMKKSETPSVGN